MSIKAPYISDAVIKINADEQLTIYSFTEKIPVEIEKILDNELKKNIIPFPNLKRVFNIYSLTLSNLHDIYIDQYCYDYLEPQYRFSLAHEFGHILLHADIYRNHNFKNIESYNDFIASFDEREYSIFEHHANCFAGHLLVPTEILKKQFYLKSASIISFIQRRFKGKRRDDYIELALDIIATNLKPIFNVHESPLKIRIQKEGLDKKIP